MILVYVTLYLLGREGETRQAYMPQVPHVGDTMHFGDRAWRVDHVRWTLGDTNHDGAHECGCGHRWTEPDDG
jgi:hypothetical protein